MMRKSITNIPQWRPKNNKWYIATALNVNLKNNWYIDSACSHHMIGDKQVLVDLRSCADEYVTFGDEERGKVLGKGTLNVFGFPKIIDVMFVEGLKANLINISQLCDQGLFVKFYKDH